MTKALGCGKCADLRMLSQKDYEPISCRCGNVTAWWGRKGDAIFTAKIPSYAFGVGFNNHFWQSAMNGICYGNPTDEDWRELHREQGNAPGYLFDTSRRDCWVVLFKPNTVGGVTWATDEDRAKVGLFPYPEGHALKR